MALSTTEATLYERVAENVWGDQERVKITATSGSTTTFVAASLGNTSMDTNAYDGVWVYILNDAGGAGAAPQNEISRVNAAGFTAASGTLTVSPAYTTAVASGDTGLLLYGLHIDQLQDAINDIQRSCYVPRYLPLTLVTDGDFEATGVTNWTDVVGTPTQTKEISTVLIGTQSLKIVTTTLGHAVTSANIAVIPGEHLLLSTPIMNSSGSLIAQLYDVTNSAVIDSVTVAGTMWTEVRFEATVPSGCVNVAIRYASATAATTAYVGWCSLLSRERTLYALPASIADTTHLEGIYLSDIGWPAVASKSYLALSDRFLDWDITREWRDWRAVNNQRIELNTLSFFPVFLKFRSIAPTLSALTDTTPLPEDLVVAGAVAGCFRRLGNERKAAQWGKTYMEMLDRYGLAKPVTQYQPQRRVRVP